MTIPQGKKRKITHVAERPYQIPEIPDLTSTDEQILLQLLYSLLEPIGIHRSQYVQPSKGKRYKKRQKRALKQTQSTSTATTGSISSPPSANAPAPPPPPPPPPEISQHVLVGFNAVNRHLSDLAAFSAPLNSKAQISEPSNETPSAPTPIATVFYCTNISNLLTNHLPLLGHLASLNQPDHPSIRLIPLSDARASDKLSKALHLPRVSFVGVKDDGYASTSALVELCREKAGPVHISWLDNVGKGQYESVKVRKVETFEDLGKRREPRKKKRKVEEKEKDDAPREASKPRTKIEAQN